MHGKLKYVLEGADPDLHLVLVQSVLPPGSEAGGSRSRPFTVTSAVTALLILPAKTIDVAVSKLKRACDAFRGVSYCLAKERVARHGTNPAVVAGGKCPA